MSINPSASLSYLAPQSQYAGKANFQSFQPISGTVFGANENIQIHVHSSDSFIDFNKSYLKYNLKSTGTTTTSGTCSILGGVSALRQVTTLVNGIEVERINHYNQYVSQIYKNSTASYKQAVKVLESYDSVGEFHTVSGLANGRVVCHALRTAITEQPKIFPLKYTSGVTLEFSLAPVTDLCGTVTWGTAYEISSVEFCATMIQPLKSLDEQYASLMASGRVMNLPLQVVRNMRTALSANTIQTIQLQPGHLQSLRSALITLRLASGVVATSTDAFNIDSLIEMKKYRFEADSQQYPRNKYIECNNVLANGAINPEAIAQRLIAVDNTFIHYNPPAHVGTDTGSGVFYSFCAVNGFDAGIPLKSGLISWELECATAPTANAQHVDVFLTSDAVLQLQLEGASLYLKDLPVVS